MRVLELEHVVGAARQGYAFQMLFTEKSRRNPLALAMGMKAHHQLRRKIGYGASRPMFLENDMAFESKADSVKSLAIDGRSHKAPNLFGQQLRDTNDHQYSEIACMVISRAVCRAAYSCGTCAQVSATSPRIYPWGS